MIEVCLLFQPGARILGRVPGVEVCVEVQDSNLLAVDAVEGAEGGEGNAMVTSEGQDLGFGEGGTLSCRFAAAKDLVCFSHLPEGNFVVEGSDGNVSTVLVDEPDGVGIDAGAWVKASIGDLKC